MSAAPSRRASALVVAAVGLLAALPLAEIGFRALRLAPPLRVIDVTHDDTVYMRSENPILGFEIKPDWRDPDADCMRSYPFTNSHGQRDVERTLAKPPGVTRVLLLGASIVEGVGLKELDDTISRQLERMEGAGTEVLNFGVSAYCTRAKVELLRVKGLAFDPDVVVLFVSENDFRNFNFEAFELAPRVDRPAGVDWLYEHSAAFRALAVRGNWFQFAAQNDPEAWNHASIGDNNVVDGMAEFARLARENGFDPIVAIWPQFRDDVIVDTDPAPGAVDGLLFEAIASMYGLPSFRFSPYFRAEWERNPGANPRVRYTIGDLLHPNPFGARLAAAALATQIPALRGRFRPDAGGVDSVVVEAAKDRGDRADTGARRMVNVGNSELAAGRLDEAILNYQRAILLEPTLAEAHHNLGVALRKQGRLPEALMAFEAAIRAEPILPDAHFNRGVTLRRLGRDAEAEEALRRALELRPDYPDARRELDALRAGVSR